ncbi:MAG: hypothetical protein R3D46_06280 [Defluviimonas denitrificans]
MPGTQHLLCDSQGRSRRAITTGSPRPAGTLFPWERLILSDPDYFFESCLLLGGGKKRLDDFDADQLEAYRTAWRDPKTVRDVRRSPAAASLDFALDEGDLGRKVPTPRLSRWRGGRHGAGL